MIIHCSLWDRYPSFRDNYYFWQMRCTFRKKSSMHVLVSLVLSLAFRPRAFVWFDLVPVLLSSICIYVSFRTYMFISPLMISGWVSFGRTTWRLPSFTQTPRRPFRPFTWYVTFCVFILLLHVFWVIIRLTRPTMFCGIHWLVGRVMSSSIPFPPLTKNSRRGSSRFIFSQRQQPTFFMRPVGRGFPLLDQQASWF